MADMLITVPDSILYKFRNSSTRTVDVSVALEHAVEKGIALPEGSTSLIISAIRKYELIHEIATVTNTPFEEVSEKLDQMNREFRAMADEWTIGKEEKLDKLKSQLSRAGDRRDWDECERIEAEIEELKGEP